MVVIGFNYFILTTLTLIKKKIPKKISGFYGKLRPNYEKRLEKSGDPLPVYSAPPSKSCYAPQKCLKLFVVVLPTKNPIASQKNKVKIYV